jgi:hypothetical protein
MTASASASGRATFDTVAAEAGGDRAAMTRHRERAHALARMIDDEADRTLLQDELASFE